MSKRKGYYHEVAIAGQLNEAGIPTRRVPLSGALKHLGKDMEGDLQILDRWQLEVKYRKDGKGFIQLERWMQDSDILVLKRARQQPLVMMQWDTFVALMQRDINGQ